MKRNSFFWTSYSDLMTSLFFIMLVLFVLTIVMLEKSHRTTREKLEKIEAIENAIKGIDPKYFAYNEQFKKHVLKIDVHFEKRDANIFNISSKTRHELIEAGHSIVKFMQEEHRKNPDVNYLLVIEGQASRDDWWVSSLVNNNVLSYQRAWGLWQLWQKNGIVFGEECEPLICGSGQDGLLRSEDNSKNQRFLIHIIPKPGVVGMPDK